MKRRNFLTAIFAAPAAIAVAKSVDRTHVPVPKVEVDHSPMGVVCTNGFCAPIEGYCPKEEGYCVECISPYDLNWDKKVGFKMRVKKGHNKVLHFKPGK